MIKHDDKTEEDMANDIMRKQSEKNKGELKEALKWEFLETQCVPDIENVRFFYIVFNYGHNLDLNL